jgi:hypothetical protein
MPEYKDEHYIINAWSEGFTVKKLNTTEDKITFYNKKAIKNIIFYKSYDKHNMECKYINDSYAITIENISQLAYEFILNHTYAYNKESESNNPFLYI